MPSIEVGTIGGGTSQSRPFTPKCSKVMLDKLIMGFCLHYSPVSATLDADHARSRRTPSHQPRRQRSQAGAHHLRCCGSRGALVNVCPSSGQPCAIAHETVSLICFPPKLSYLKSSSPVLFFFLFFFLMRRNRSAPVTPSTVHVTGHSYLTPAPTRPGTPSASRQNGHPPSMTPLLHTTPASARKGPPAFPF